MPIQKEIPPIDIPTCKECGSTGQDVGMIACGYKKELLDEIVLEMICDQCEKEHLMDI